MLKRIGHWFDSHKLAREYTNEGRKGFLNISQDNVDAIAPALTSAIAVVKERGTRYEMDDGPFDDPIEGLGGSNLGEIQPIETPMDYDVVDRNGEYINASSVDVRTDPVSIEPEDDLHVNYRMKIGDAIYRCYVHFIRGGVFLSIDDMSDRSIDEQAAKTGSAHNLLYVLEADNGLRPVPFCDLKQEEYELIMYILKRVAK